MGWGGGRHSAGVSERGGGERGAHLPQDAGLKLSPHLGSDRDDMYHNEAQNPSLMAFQLLLSPVLLAS